MMPQNASFFVTDSVESIARGLHAEDGYRFDTNDTAFFARQLEFIEQTLYQFDLKVLKHRAYIPVDNTPDPGSDTVTYRIFEKIGLAAVINNFADDLPRADIVGSEHRAPVRSIATSFGFSTHDLRRARMANLPLDSFKAESAQRAVDEQESGIAWLGDAPSNLGGFLNNVNVPTVQAAAAAGGSFAREWDGADKTPDEIIADFTTGISTPRVNTRGARSVDTCLMPIPQYNKLATTPRGSVNDTTILQFISAPNNAFGLTAIDWVNEMAAAFAGPVDGAAFYERNPAVVQQRITMERIVLPMQQRNLEFIIPVEARNGGVVVRYPLAALFMTDV
ncbi:MAG: DUF2184 domain-containing protein [Planctomycetes bacterium]|nr:DUF2184 domain-containing protein [Planctomycetota bacterium]